jgi:hypothetical protein
MGTDVSWVSASRQAITGTGHDAFDALLHIHRHTRARVRPIGESPSNASLGNVMWAAIIVSALATKAVAWFAAWRVIGGFL